ncbi:MAG: tail fiber domain-containing protein [Candidatus Babeliaceae bacterium]|jgi:hypothetical protein
MKKIFLLLLMPALMARADNSYQLDADVKDNFNKLRELVREYNYNAPALEKVFKHLKNSDQPVSEKLLEKAVKEALDFLHNNKVPAHHTELLSTFSDYDAEINKVDQEATRATKKTFNNVIVKNRLITSNLTVLDDAHFLGLLTASNMLVEDNVIIDGNLTVNGFLNAANSNLSLNNTGPTGATGATGPAGSAANINPGNNFEIARYTGNSSNVIENSRMTLSEFTTSPQNYIALKVEDDNTSFVISPSGTGGLIGNVPDSTAVGGNARGANAVDWQTTRTDAAQVASGSRTVISGGQNNTANGVATAIGGGISNTGSGDASVISGGQGNLITAGGDRSTISGGQNNTISQTFSFIGAGTNNNITNTGSVVGGGSNNTGAGNFSFVGGGEINNTLSTDTVIGGGTHNLINAVSDAAFIGGGDTNIITGRAAVISGGATNASSADHTFIGGGQINTVSGLESVIGGGNSNIVTAANAVVVGGLNNTGAGTYSVVGGGLNNDASTIGSFIGGGGNNIVSGNTGAIVGGQSNTGSGLLSFIGGGVRNIASGTYSVVGGGQNNDASTIGSFIGGGGSNIVSGNTGAIAGGQSNTGSGAFSFVGGGQNNIASGLHSAVLGGLSNKASGPSSVAIGETAIATNTRQFVISDGSSSLSVGADVGNSFSVIASNGIFMKTLPAAAGTTVTYDTTTNQLTLLPSTQDLKENVKGLPDSSWIYKLNGKQYNYINTDPVENVSFGWLAEDVAKINDDLVIYHENKPYALQHTEFLPFIVEEMKKHENTIKNLQQSRVQDMQRLEGLIQKVKALESKIK